MDWGRFFKEVGFIIATTIGAGIFALPFVFKEAGWGVSFFYLVVLGGMVVAVHALYWRMLVEVGRRERLLGILRQYLGKTAFYLALAAVFGGLILAMVAYLILGAEFLALVVPSLGSASLLVFWLLVSLPLIFKLGRVLWLEIFGGILMIGIVAFIFQEAWPIGGSLDLGLWRSENIFLPFGVILFSLAGWTALEPIYDSYRGRSTGLNFTKRIFQFSSATFGSALVYLLFVIAILVSASQVTPDTISGLHNWPAWQLKLLGIFGLFAIATSYWPFGLEVESLTTRDFKLSRIVGTALVFVLPIALVLFGLRNFLEVVGLVGGVFLALQYFFIVIAAKRILGYRGLRKFWLFGLATVFILGVIYEIYYFVIR